MWFESTDNSIASLSEESREEHGDSMLVTLKVEGVSASVDKEDVDIQALRFPEEGSVNRTLAQTESEPEVLATCPVTIVVPLNQIHEVDQLTPVNTSLPLQGGYTLLITEVTGICRITILDQFGDPLNPVYDGVGYVHERWTITPPSQYIYNMALRTGPIDQPPPGLLNSGVIEDKVGVGASKIVAGLTPQNLVDWAHFIFFIPGTLQNNVFADVATPHPECRVSQHIEVHGNPVTPSYERTIWTYVANYPATICTVTDEQE